MASPSVLTTTDWNEEWKRLQATRHRSDDAAQWDARAKTFPVKHGSQSAYVERFLALAAVRPGETVLDMGCGTGALATPLAQEGCKVIACDFSRAMLEVMEEDQAALGVTGVEVRQMSWADDWEAEGLGPRSVDVALASRSIATDDLRGALEKLTAAARRRVCITLPCSLSPKVDDRLLEAAGLSPRLGSDFLYGFNILAAMGIHPEVAYIPSQREDRFQSPQEALEAYGAMVRRAAASLMTSVQEKALEGNLKAWLDQELVQRDGAWSLKTPRQVLWAFMAWDIP